MMLLSIEYEEEAVFPQYQNNNFGHILHELYLSIS